MGEREINKLLERVRELSTLPEVTQRILSITEDPDSSARDLNEVLRHDMALSAKLLRVVNSAFYGLPGRVTDIDRALVLLGFQAVRNLAIAATMASFFQAPEQEIQGFSPKRLWRHSVATAVAARRIVNVVGLRSLREEAFLAGIIHDLGVLVEYQYATKQFRQVMERINEQGSSLIEAEQSVFEFSHQKIGQSVVERWKFPKNMQMVMGYHHRPERLAEEHRLLPAVTALAGSIAESTGYAFLDQGVEGYPDEAPDLGESVTLEDADREAVRQELPELVEQASSWLDL